MMAEEVQISPEAFLSWPFCFPGTCIYSHLAVTKPSHPGPGLTAGAPSQRLSRLPFYRIPITAVFQRISADEQLFTMPYGSILSTSNSRLLQLLPKPTRAELAGTAFIS